MPSYIASPSSIISYYFEGKDYIKLKGGIKKGEIIKNNSINDAISSFLDLESSASVLLALLGFGEHVVRLLDRFRNELLHGLGHRVGSVRVRLGQTADFAQEALDAFLGSHGRENNFRHPLNLGDSHRRQAGRALLFSCAPLPLAGIRRRAVVVGQEASVSKGSGTKLGSSTSNSNNLICE